VSRKFILILGSIAFGYMTACSGGTQTPQTVTIRGDLERVDLSGFRACDGIALEWLNWYLGNRSVTFFGAAQGQAIGSATSETSLRTRPQGTACLGDAPFSVSLPKQALFQAVVHLSSGDQSFSISFDELRKAGYRWTLPVS